MTNTPTAHTELAHVRQCPETGVWREHFLNEHLNNTACRAEKFANAFANGDWANLAGLLHDFGKFNPAWQTYLKNKTGYDPDAHLESNGKLDHSTAGAIYAQESLGYIGQLFAYLIAGHHSGLPDWEHEISVGGALKGRLQEKRHLENAKKGNVPQEIVNLTMPASQPCINRHGEYLHLWMRMLFSCLVDADFLDTENFMDNAKGGLRSEFTESMLSLKSKFDKYMDKKEKNAPNTLINQIRSDVLNRCRKSGTLPSGFFSLTVPTGGGKTLASMGFALEHAIAHNKDRIIVVIPYTSIIEQTASVLREVFGEYSVIEHHCNLDPEVENYKNHLASENWDAPIIVTTNVQFFESLFASKTSSCRKLHNIAGSVIILDEAQMLPSDFLKPIISTIKGLTQCFGVSVLLCTATQPALIGEIGSQMSKFKGLENDIVREIITDTTELSNKLQRVEFVAQDPELKPVEWTYLAKELDQYEQVLCIVNTRKDCRELYEKISKNKIHLSALMCPAHRSDVIKNIKEKLNNREPLKVISTQLVEAGVDVDFPVVYRALAGLDSLVQAAGRCNREGRLAKGKVFYFAAPKQAPPGLMRKGEEATRELISLNQTLNGDPELFTRYFKLFFNKVNTFDKEKMYDLLEKNPCSGLPQIQFRTAASKFKLIDNQSRRPIIVIYPKHKTIIESLIEKLHYSASKEILRKLQRYTISVEENILKKLQAAGEIKQECGFWVQATDGLYDEVLGLNTKNDLTWSPERFIL